MSAMTTHALFDGHNITIIDHAGQKWLTAEQAGLCLGYSESNAKDGAARVYQRNADEFGEEDSVTVKLTATDGKRYDMRVFSQSGCVLLSMLSNAPRAKEFRAWAKQVLTRPALSHERRQLAPETMRALQKLLMQSKPVLYKVMRLERIAGLRQTEKALLLGVCVDTYRAYLHQLTAVGLADYQPSPGRVRAGQMGIRRANEARRAARLNAQPSLFAADVGREGGAQ